ncbi:hypothetical protein [Agriterribacter humi]|nr:hypothetical protein [Agriterribacter humi]
MSLFPDYEEKINGFRYRKKEESPLSGSNDEAEENIKETPEELIESG